MASTDTRLGNRILIGLAVGAVAGVLVHLLSDVFPALLPRATWLAANVLDPFGQIFLRLLFFVVLPLVFCSLAHGVLQLGDVRALGGLATRTFALFLLNMAVGTLLGLLMMNLLRPGSALSPEMRVRLIADYGGAARTAIQSHADSPAFTFGTLVDMFLPRNLFGAFVGNDRKALGDVLPLIVFAILVGVAGTGLASARHAMLREALETGMELMTRIVHFALRLAPLAVPALIFSVVVRIGPAVLVALGLFVVGCIGVLLLPHDPQRIDHGVHHQLQQCHVADGAGRGTRGAGHSSADRRFRTAARHDDEHERHRALRGLRGAVRGAGVRRGADAGRAADTAAAGGLERRGRGRHSRRFAAADRRPADQLRHSARRHRHHPRHRSPAGHDAHHGQCRLRHGDLQTGGSQSDLIHSTA